MACAFGTVYSLYTKESKIDLGRVRKIREAISVPIVMHGGSGLTDNYVKRAIKKGISKVNILKDINIAAVKAESSKFTDMNKGIIDLIPAAVEAIKKATIEKMELFSRTAKHHLVQMLR